LKIVFVDYSVFVHKAIFAWRVMPKKSIPATFTGLSMIFNCLGKVGLYQEDLVIFACDSPKGSWRREVDGNYKADRKAKRNKIEDIDWSKQFFDFGQLAQNIELSTPYYFVEAEKLEADDIIAYGVRHFNDKECTIISSDSDFEQLVAFPNVKLFSPISKKYKHITQPYKIIAKKIQKEATDNLVTPILTSEDYEKRKSIVNLLELPSWVEETVAVALSSLQEKTFDINNLMFKSLRDRFYKLYDGSKIVSFQERTKKKTKVKRAKTP
jgi:5'-3' exonuclease